jgi:glycerol-3-phosphate dehydrogenase (NAD(P)+)
MKIGILGCGNWGSVFGLLQHRNGHSVKIWEYNKARAEKIIKTRNNEPFLVGHDIPTEIEIHWDIERIAKNAELIVFALPSQVLNSVVTELKNITIPSRYFLSLTKGIDTSSLLRPSEIIGRLPSIQDKIYVLSGPCIANEIIRGEPTAAVVVGHDPSGTRDLQQQLTVENFRIYQSEDIIGVEFGAALKNVIALGCGISDGLGYGNNAKGVLITRGIVEIQRLGTKMGAQAKTFWGLSGLGDLVTTAFSNESRNHTFGTQIGAGKSCNEVTKSMVMVAEGVPTCRAVMNLADTKCVEMPICKAVHDILFRGKSPQQAIRDLMTRPLKYE